MRRAGMFALLLFPAVLAAQSAKAAKKTASSGPTITLHAECDAANHFVKLSADPWNLGVGPGTDFTWEVDASTDPTITVSVSPTSRANWPWQGGGGKVGHGQGNGTNSGKPKPSQAKGPHHYVVHATCFINSPDGSPNVTMDIDPDVTIDVSNPKGKKPAPTKPGPKKPDA